MSAATLGLFRGGDIDAAGNRDFVRAFIRDAVGKADQAAMIAADGTMSQDAARRIQAALLARAYGDADLVAALMESAESNIRDRRGTVRCRGAMGADAGDGPGGRDRPER